MPANLLAEDVGSILAGRLDDAADDLLLVNPDEASVGQLVETLAEREDPPQVSVVAGDRFLKDVMEDFLVASRAADLVDRDVLTLRTIEDPPNQALLVTEDDITALVTVADGIGALRAEDEELVDAAEDFYGTIETDAAPFTLRTPPLSRIRDTLAEEIGEESASDFDAVLASLEDVREDGSGLDEVTISLLVAARNNELLYDISKWGEDVGLASKATFSRTKTTLEDAGLIDTEKVPIQVGRPRLRLLLGSDRLANADPAEMAARAQQLLAE